LALGIRLVPVEGLVAVRAGNSHQPSGAAVADHSVAPGPGTAGVGDAAEAAHYGDPEAVRLLEQAKRSTQEGRLAPLRLRSNPSGQGPTSGA
jgi:hypothetical protein